MHKARSTQEAAPLWGRLLTVFCSLCLNGRDVSQRVGELLAARPERRRLGNIADPACFRLSKIEDGRLALRKRHRTVSAAVVDSDSKRLTSLELKPGSPAGECFIALVMLQTDVARM